MIHDLDQENASKYILNHSLIIAGAGSGKTTTLLKKIDYLIDNKIKENEILVISFTNETVNNFKKKCKHNIEVLTFHKLANKITNNQKEIVDDELLESCVIKFLNSVTEKLQKRIYHIIYHELYSLKKYYDKVQNINSKSITNMFLHTIKQIKANIIDIDNININQFNKSEKILIYCIKNILRIYDNELKENNYIDFNNMILSAIDAIKNKEYISKYKHILVDEYQDISKLRLKFLTGLINLNNSILTAVGDDFQSIYGFSGSNIDLFYNFQKYFPSSKIFYIKTSYRCPQKIIKKAGKFIMKNPKQIKKEIFSISKIKGKIIKYKPRNNKNLFIKLIRKYQNTDKSVLILGRNNFDINYYIDKNTTINNSYIVYDNIICNNIRYLTVHKSKGLEADIVIIINLKSGNQGFPNFENNELINKLLNKEETYMFAEERRLFYVALTRCKIKTYLLIDKNNPSEFIKEI